MNATELACGVTVFHESVPARVTGTTALRCPASGPQDVRVYLTLAEFERATGGALTPDGRVVLVNANDRRITEVDLDVLDQLEKQGWVESVDTTTIRMTDKGRWWLAKFVKANRFLGG